MQMFILRTSQLGDQAPKTSVINNTLSRIYISSYQLLRNGVGICWGWIKTHPYAFVSSATAVRDESDDTFRLVSLNIGSMRRTLTPGILVT